MRKSRINRSGLPAVDRPPMKRARRDHDKTSPPRVDAALRREEALFYRLSGMNYKTIGEKMGVSSVRAYQLVSEELAWRQEHNHEMAGQIMRMELDRLDEMHEAVWNMAKAGHGPSQDRVLAIMARRDKLVGLDTIKASVDVNHAGAIKTEHLVDIADLPLDVEVKQAILEALRTREAAQKEEKQGEGF